MSDEKNDKIIPDFAPKTSMPAYAWAALLAAAAGFLAVYVIGGRPDNGLRRSDAPKAPMTVAAPAAPKSATSGINPLSTGQMATFVFNKTPEALPELAFIDGTGKPKTLKDWRGKVVLLNLWATWCAPCRKEMPGLDLLQKELGSDKFEVLALSVDRKGADASKRFLDQIKVRHLGVYNDPTARIFTQLRGVGMPTTLLLDAKGREIGRLVGPAEWDSDDAKRLIKAQL